MFLSSVQARTWSESNAPNEPDINKKQQPFQHWQNGNILIPNQQEPLIKDGRLVPAEYNRSTSRLNEKESSKGIDLNTNKPAIPNINRYEPTVTEPDKSVSYSKDANIYSVSDKIATAPVKNEDKPTATRSFFHVGLRGTFEFASFDSSVAESLKTHHSYVEKTHPFSLGLEVALHKFYKYIYLDGGIFGQTDFGYTLSDKNKLEGSYSFGIFGNIGLPELIHFDKFRIIPAVGVEGTISGKFQAFDLSAVGSLYFVYSHVYTKLSFCKGFMSEEFKLKNNDTDAEESMKINKSYIQLSLGYWD